MLSKITLALNTYSKACNLMKTQYQPEKIAEIQLEKLKVLISYSYENIKYYRELLDEHSIKPCDIQNPADIIKLPLLTKKELRERFWDFLPKELPPCRVSRTSGSTGVPVCILSDVNSRMNNSAAVFRYRKALGIGTAAVILTPQKNEAESRKNPHWTFLQGLHKTVYVNPYSNKTSEIEYAKNIIRRLGRPAIIGITPAIRALAYRVRDEVFPKIQPCAILTLGECLTPQVRELLESTFKTRVSDIYACNEAGDVAWQCQQGQYHINAENCILEVLKDGKPVSQGQTGEVVVTNLNRFSMPIIRYKNGDIARYSSNSCTCGCKLPVISEIIGRAGEDITLPCGKIVPWNQLKGLMNHPQLRQFQIIQNASGNLTINIVPENGVDTEQVIGLLRSRFNGLLGDAVDFDFAIVEKIAPAASGKSKLVISDYLRA